MAEVQPPSYEAGQCYTPEQDRALWASIICSEGVQDRAAGDLRVTASGGMSVSVAAGEAWIEGDQVANQGFYFVRNSGPVTLTHAASDPVDNRIDLVVARVYDAQYSGTDSRWALEIVKGVPSPAPVAPTAPANTITLAQVLIRAAATSVITSDITDTRQQFQMCTNTQPAQGLIGYQVFTSSGTFTPASYPGIRSVKVRLVGGGGGGGACSSTGAGAYSVGGGGGGGGYVEAYIPSTSLAASVPVTVGQGGAGSAAGSGADGISGGASSFGGAGTPLANGGTGGQYGNAVTGGLSSAGGSGGGGSGGLVIPGGQGGRGRVISGGVIEFGIGGGTSLSPARVLSPNGSAGGPGVAGTVYGMGGGGAFIGPATTSVAGGNGANGVVIVEVYG